MTTASISNMSNNRYRDIVTHVTTALDVQISVYGMWNEVSTDVVQLGEAVVLNLLLRKKDGREVTATRKLAHLKTVDPDGYKQAKDDAKAVREIIKEQAETRGLDKATPRQIISRVTEKAAEMIGMPKPEATGSNGGSTSYDKVAEALRTLRNHLPQCEAEVFAEMETTWADLEEIAVRIGLLKESE
jgi:hypothetical protein